jgi:MerR family transcriptional regulator, copper efflux regulator
MWIGEAAEQAGVNVQTIRYYERRGLLPRPARRASGYRELAPDTVRLVRFIRRAQDLGFSLDEVAELLRLRRTRQDRARVRAVASRRLRQIDGKITELVAMREALRRLIHACRAGATLECPILEALEGGPTAPGGSQ